MTQHTLELVLPQASKHIDPVTSHEAEAKITQSGKRKTHAILILEALKVNPNHTSAELAEKMKPGDFKWRMTVARRLPDLMHNNLVKQGDKRKCRVTKNESVVWRAI